MQFRDRQQAGEQLGEELMRRELSDPVILGLPRGGVPVAAVVAQRLAADLDVLVVRKLGVPTHPEVAMGAVGEGAVTVLNPEVVRNGGVTQPEVDEAAERERAEVEARADRFRHGAAAVDLTGRTAVLVDDGIATGATVRAACQVARAFGAARVVVAVPVAPPEVLASLTENGDADDVVCLHSPRQFGAVGAFYARFSQVPDDEVIEILSGG